MGGVEVVGSGSEGACLVTHRLICSPCKLRIDCRACARCRLPCAGSRHSSPYDARRCNSAARATNPCPPRFLVRRHLPSCLAALYERRRAGDGKRGVCTAFVLSWLQWAWRRVQTQGMTHHRALKRQLGCTVRANRPTEFAGFAIGDIAMFHDQMSK